MQTIWFCQERISYGQWRRYPVLLLGIALFISSTGLPISAQIKSPGTLGARLAPCCQIVRINSQTGVAVARINSTGKTFIFVAKNPTLLSSLKAGQNIFANLKTRQVSLDGRNACCQIGGFGTWVRYGRVVSVSGNQIAVARPARQVGGVKAVSTTGGSPGTTSTLVLPALRPLTPSGGPFGQGTRGAFIPPQPHPGQTIWVDQQMGLAQYITFPFQSQIWDEPSNGDHMQTQITISYGNSAGQINGTTHVYTGRAAYGFKGTVRVVFLDDSGTALFTTNPQSWTVVGTAEAAIPNNGSNDVTNSWTQSVPLDALNQVRAVAIVHSAVDLAFEQILAFAQKIYQCAAAVYQAYQQSSGSTGGQTTGDGQGGGDGTVFALGTSSGGSQDGNQQGPNILQACFNMDSGGSSSSAQFAQNYLRYEDDGGLPGNRVAAQDVRFPIQWPQTGTFDSRLH